VLTKGLALTTKGTKKFTTPLTGQANTKGFLGVLREGFLGELSGEFRASSIGLE
jgi:hypothetical protein